MTKALELTGRVFGQLTVIKFVGGPRRRWLCDCTCGKTAVIAQPDLIGGHTKSCGHRHSEQLADRNRTHGMTNTYTYKKWHQMNTRIRDTDNPKNACYRDVHICCRWRKFENFYLDMGEAPTGYSLDRIDNKRGYIKDNCRWVPLAIQSSNTSRNVVVSFNGTTAHVSEHCRRVGLRPDLVFDRVNKLGWSVERALGTPPRRCNRSR